MQLKKEWEEYRIIEKAVMKYLNRLIPTNWYDMSLSQRIEWLKDERNVGTEKRTLVCVQEIVNESSEILARVVDPNNKHVWNLVSSFIQSIRYPDGTRWYKKPNSVRIPLYGKQRIFVREKREKKE